MQRALACTWGRHIGCTARGAAKLRSVNPFSHLAVLAPKACVAAPYSGSSMYARPGRCGASLKIRVCAAAIVAKVSWMGCGAGRGSRGRGQRPGHQMLRRVAWRGMGPPCPPSRHHASRPAPHRRQGVLGLEVQQAHAGHRALCQEAGHVADAAANRAQLAACSRRVHSVTHGAALERMFGAGDLGNLCHDLSVQHGPHDLWQEGGEEGVRCDHRTPRAAQNTLWLAQPPPAPAPRHSSAHRPPPPRPPAHAHGHGRGAV